METRTVYYATNRQATGSGDKPRGYSGRPSGFSIENLRLGHVTFKVDPVEEDRRLFASTDAGPGDGGKLASYYKKRVRAGAIQQYPEKLTEDKKGEKPLPASEQKLGSRQLFELLRQEMAPVRNRQGEIVRDGNDVLVYVHGYSVDWTSAVASAAALGRMLNRKRGVGQKKVFVLLFSWPSDGKKTPWLAYGSDREDAERSGYALGRGLLKLRDYLGGLGPDQYCGQNLHLLCHSMGNWVLENALYRFLRFHGARPLPRVLDNIFMCSPDVDDDVFELRPGARDEKLLPLTELARNVTIYHNRGDKALIVSDTTKGHPNRLGAGGVTNPQTLHARIHQVDCSEIAPGFVEHSYYMLGRVNEDIRRSIDDVSQDAIERTRLVTDFRNSWKLV